MEAKPITTVRLTDVVYIGLFRLVVILGAKHVHVNHWCNQLTGVTSIAKKAKHA